MKKTKPIRKLKNKTEHNYLLDFLKLLFYKNYCIRFKHSGFATYTNSIEETLNFILKNGILELEICDTKNNMEKVGYIQLEHIAEKNYPRIFIIGNYISDGNPYGNKITNLCNEIEFLQNIDILNQIT